MKKIINYIILFVLLFSGVTAADYYSTYEVAFSGAAPASIYVAGAGCSDNSCKFVNTNNIEIFNGDSFSSCWDSFIQDNNDNTFISCIANAKIDGNIADLSQMGKITVKENTANTYGTMTQFFTSNDSYLPLYSKTGNYNCTTDICVDTTLGHLNFEKKANAIAEVGKVNVINLNDKLKPVQVQVPVTINEAVCSAFRFVDSNTYRFTAPSGYSDYSALTSVNLKISNDNTNANYLNQTINIPIEADSCAGLAAFAWTPSSTLENTPVKFEVTTDVIDNQVESSIPDFANVVETVYPTDLNNSCWTVSNDFTLSNVDNFNINTSVAQISEGESLFALFKAGAFRDNAKTPMNFEAILSFNGTIVYNQLLNSNNDLSSYSIDLSSSLVGLSAGAYDVKLTTRPVGTSCSVSKPVVQTQKLQLLVPQNFYANFYVKDSNGNNLNGATINLELLNADDYYQTTPIYNLNQITNNAGFSVFNNVISGDYKYTISKSGYTSVTNNIKIGSNSDVYITMPGGNTAPVVAFPDNFTAFYQDQIKFNLKNYISDFNDDFADLTITTHLISGNVVVNRVGDDMIFTTNAPNVAKVEIFAQDPSGLVSSDIVTVYFTDNSAPVIDNFNVSVSSGAAPLNTQFSIAVSDASGDSPDCTIDFGDGTSYSSSCSSIPTISHTYNNIGTFNAKLSVDDGSNPLVEKTVQIFVFERKYESPVIDSFTLTSSNGVELPTDLTLYWSASHTANYPITCEIRYNGNATPVSCVGSLSIPDFRVNGTTDFHLIVTDNNSIQVVRTISKAFGAAALLQMMNADNTNLILSDIVTPGKFPFGIYSTNEVVQNREFSIKPIISCNGIDYTLTGANKYLDSTGRSANRTSDFTFMFNSNTLNFNGNIPTDTLCTFSVLLKDAFDSNLKLTKPVTFSYPQAVQQLQSIRGKSTDVVDYMASTVKNGGFRTGYNSMQFILSNNNFNTKTLSINVNSLDLGLSQNVEENLGPGKDVKVQIPVYVKNNIKPGMYPVRISAYDGEDKQVRYSYIKIS